MHKATRILETLSIDPGLAQQLRLGDLAAFERLSLGFDELYASQEDKDSDLCTNTCITTCSGGTDGWPCQA